MSGVFVAFEGPEGAGKTTQIGHLLARLQHQGYRAVRSREPGGTPLGEGIRQLLLDPALAIDPLPEFLLYAASRAQHVSAYIRPALETNHIVISDRFSGASLAYQGYGRGLDIALVQSLNERATAGLQPHLTLLLDIEVSRGLARIAERGEPDRLERADITFHQRVRQGFLAQAHADARWRLLDADQDEVQLAAQIWEMVWPMLENL